MFLTSLSTAIFIFLSSSYLVVNNAAHRAIEDVKAMNQVFQNNGFSMVLERLTQRSIAQIERLKDTTKFHAESCGRI